MELTNIYSTRSAYVSTKWSWFVFVFTLLSLVFLLVNFFARYVDEKGEMLCSAGLVLALGKGRMCRGFGSYLPYVSGFLHHALKLTFHHFTALI